jgi:hypothetical protein
LCEEGVEQSAVSYGFDDCSPAIILRLIRCQRDTTVFCVQEVGIIHGSIIGYSGCMSLGLGVLVLLEGKAALE